MAKAVGDEDPGVTRVARAYAALAHDDARGAAPRRPNGRGHDIDLRDHADDGDASAPDAHLVAERPWERSLNHLTAVLVGQRNDHAELRAAMEELSAVVAQGHDALEAARAERAHQRAGDLARHAALLDQLASALAQVDDLAAQVKRQQGQITRLRSEVKKLKAADG